MLLSAIMSPDDKLAFERIMGEGQIATQERDSIAAYVRTLPESEESKRSRGRPQLYPELAHLPPIERAKQVRLLQKARREGFAATRGQERSFNLRYKLNDGVLVAADHSAEWFEKFHAWSEKVHELDEQARAFMAWYETRYAELAAEKEALK